MRAVVQRVSRASVTVDTQVTGSIERGLLVLLGAGAGDTDEDLRYIVDKVVNLRIFPDDAAQDGANAGERAGDGAKPANAGERGKMNRSVLDIGGGVLVVSQFTLYGDVRQGRRPAFTGALEPTAAKTLYERSLDAIRAAGVTRVEAGVFAADMQVDLLNDGPVTILIDSRKLF